MMNFIGKWLQRLAYLIAAYAVLFVGIFLWQMAAASLRDPDADLVDNSKQGIAERQTQTAQIIESVREIVNLNRQPAYQRDAHSKAHGCVRAEFEVYDMQEKYNFGVFSKAKKYQAWVRFSNGTVPALPDTSPDARGMAIKVMDVEGQQLLPPLLAGKTQDFVMVNSPRFFVRSVSEYVELERVTAAGKPFTYFLGEYYINPFKWRLRQLYLGLSTRSKAPATPLSAQYYSMSPYQLGPHEIKYSAKACEDYTVSGVNRNGPNFLRESMKRFLKQQDACFQLMVQIRKPDARMPIQDTTVTWSEKESPFIPVARVHIPKQEFDTPQQNALCENLSFNPWHSVQELKPISYINELRRDLYLHTAAYRRVRNGVVVGEPNSWCDSLAEYCEEPVALVPESIESDSLERSLIESSEDDSAASDRSSY